MASKKKTKGKRYSAEEKQEILDFVSEHNATKGRGGASAASKKYSVSPLTISNWSKKAGAGAPVKPGKKIKTEGAKVANVAKPAAAKRGRPTAVAAASKRSAVLAELGAVEAEIAAACKQLDALEAKFDKLKASL